MGHPNITLKGPLFKLVKHISLYVKEIVYAWEETEALISETAKIGVRGFFF